ncbi:MAG: UbiA family prenyltransferase [Candidatus Dormibacteraeota bacterium]|uniref:UbiA family prenyltransferase n=1 Tax=Candidatus Amunia macphersoniae TaxID=3127014 RepID=A0A934NAT1_9BACT|nr:UbiA family prenyltransferase [Candidatus Dormibacteraeota bacterium]
MIRFFDERSPAGGRPKAWLYLTHPGPSLLVTVVTVAAAGLLTRGLPSGRTTLGLVLVMLPGQLAIGALNDWVDVASDRTSKPFKPIARGLVTPRGAAMVTASMLAVSVATGAWFGAGVMAVGLLAVVAGTTYDLFLKRTQVAVLAWWAGFVAVPLLAMVMTGRLTGAVQTIPLAGLLSLAVLIANGLPDAAADSLAGARTLSAALGDRRSRVVMVVALLIAAAYVLAVRGSLGQGGLAVVAAALLVAGAGAAWLPARARSLMFPLLAVCVAVAAVSWLGALPEPG